MISRDESVLRAVPDLLKQIPNWVAWKLVNNDSGELTKPPFIVGTDFKRNASSTDASTWTDFKTAVAKTPINHSQGVGFTIGGEAVSKGIVGVDIDGCRNPVTGELAPWADKLIDALDSYTEVTPSKTGVRVWTIGKWPFPKNVFNLNPAAGYGDKVKIEVYHKSRYFTVTGETVFDEDVPLNETDLDSLYKLCLEIQAQNAPPAKTKIETTKSEFVKGVQIKHEGTTFTDKVTLLMTGTVQSGKPTIITDGKGNSVEYPSRSEADLGLCTMLALEYGDDTETIWQSYLKSPLCQEKWRKREEWFKANTIVKAIGSANEIKAKSTSAPTAASVEITDDAVSRIEARIERGGMVRPVFPDVMKGTSLYRNLALPISQASGKHAPLIFMPALVGLMNYAAGHVSIHGEKVILTGC